MENVSIVNVPEQGQLVEVRQRRYIVDEVAKSTLPPSTLPEGLERLQHLVSLTSVEDDALGEELQVIWELEPGAHTYDQAVLPEATTGFDSPQRLNAFLDAVRWGAASSADVRTLQAPFRSGIDIEDYQLDPLVRAIQMPRVNLLIADDVGLGDLEADLEFLMIAALKIDQIREDLGKVGPVIAEQVETAMLGGRRQLFTAEAERSAEPVRKQLKFERNLRAQVDKLHQQLQETRYTLRLSPENVPAVVEIALMQLTPIRTVKWLKT